MKNLIVVSMLVVIIFFCIGCDSKKTSNDEIKIGVIAPYEGPNAHIGEMIMNSVKLYFNQNQFSNLNIKLVPVDTKSNPSDAVAALQSVISDSKVKALIGFYHSSTALACKSVIREAKIPTLIYSASNPKVTDETSFYFRLVPTDDSQAIVLADYAKKLGATKIGILYYADEYGKGLSDGIQTRAKDIGLAIVDIKSYDSTISDFRPILTVMKSKAPDVIMICGFVEKSIAILNQAAEKNLKIPFLAGDGTFNEDQLISGVGENAEGLYVAAPYVFNESNEKNIQFLENYWKAYPSNGPQKKPASWSAFAFDSAGI